MSQRIVCRFCDWYVGFTNGVDYLEAKANFDEHLGNHHVAILDELANDICLECEDTPLIPHCMYANCEWKVCISCKMIWDDMEERKGFCYAHEDDEKRRNGV